MCKRTLLYNCIPTGVIVHTNPLLHQNDPEMICSANRFRINPKAVFVCLYCSSEWNGHFHTFLLNTSVSIHSREAHPSVLSKKKCQKATNCQMIVYHWKLKVKAAFRNHVNLPIECKTVNKLNGVYMLPQRPRHNQCIRRHGLLLFFLSLSGLEYCWSLTQWLDHAVLLICRRISNFKEFCHSLCSMPFNTD